MNQPMRVGPVQARFSSHKPILQGEAPAPKVQKDTGQDELFRFIAKIRSLEDDIQGLREQNRRVQTDNRAMVHMLDQLQQAVDHQTSQIERLTEILNQHASSGSTILHYEEQLGAVGQKVDSLHELMQEKNRKYGFLKDERDRAMSEQLKLKEQCNKLQYEENGVLQGIDQFIGGMSQKQVDCEENLHSKVDFVIQFCRSLEREVTEIGSLLERSRKEGAESVMKQKEQRIKSQYNIQLLRQRVKDYELKKNYFKNCYNEDSIQAVIDDMLAKEHSLRQEISLQNQKNNQLAEERIEALTTFEKRIGREKAGMQEALQYQNIECEIILQKKLKIESEIRKVEKSLIEIQEEGCLVSQESRENESEIHWKISQIEGENLKLEKELGELRGQMDLLQLGMN